MPLVCPERNLLLMPSLLGQLGNCESYNIFDGGTHKSDNSTALV